MGVPEVIKCERRQIRNTPQQGRRNSTGPEIVEAGMSGKRPEKDDETKKSSSISHIDTFRSIQKFFSEKALSREVSDTTKETDLCCNSSPSSSDVGDFVNLDVTPTVLEKTLRVAQDLTMMPTQGRRHSYHGSGHTERSRSFDGYLPCELKIKKPEGKDRTCSRSVDEVEARIAQYEKSSGGVLAHPTSLVIESFKLAQNAKPIESRSASRDKSSPTRPSRRRSYHFEGSPQVSKTGGASSRRPSDPGTYATASNIFGGILGSFAGRLAEELEDQPQDDEIFVVKGQELPSIQDIIADDSSNHDEVIDVLKEAAVSNRSSIQVIKNENRMLKKVNKELLSDMELQEEARREEIASLKSELKASTKKNISMSKVSQAKDAAVEKLTKDLEKRDATILALQDVIRAMKKQMDPH